MSTVKTSELIRAALDWAVAECEGKVVSVVIVDGTPQIWANDDVYDNFKNQWCYCDKQGNPRFIRNGTPVGLCGNPMASYLDWPQGGPIIEREDIDLMKVSTKQWRADCGPACYGKTPLVAAMRAYVMKRLGDEVEVPDVLVEVSHG